VQNFKNAKKYYVRQLLLMACQILKLQVLFVCVAVYYKKTAYE